MNTTHFTVSVFPDDYDNDDDDGVADVDDSQGRLRLTRIYDASVLMFVCRCQCMISFN